MKSWKIIFVSKAQKACNNSIDGQSSKIDHCVDCLYNCVNISIVDEADWVEPTTDTGKGYFVFGHQCKICKMQDLKIVRFKNCKV